MNIQHQHCSNLQKLKDETGNLNKKNGICSSFGQLQSFLHVVKEDQVLNQMSIQSNHSSSRVLIEPQLDPIAALTLAETDVSVLMSFVKGHKALT